MILLAFIFYYKIDGFNLYIEVDTMKKLILFIFILFISVISAGRPRIVNNPKWWCVCENETYEGMYDQSKLEQCEIFCRNNLGVNFISPRKPSTGIHHSL